MANNLIIQIPRLVCADTNVVSLIAARVDVTPEAVRSALRFKTFGQRPDEIRKIAVVSFGAQLAVKSCIIPRPISVQTKK